MKLRKAFFGALLCAALMGASAQAETVISNMNFRAAPSMVGMVIGSVPKGSVVTVLGSQDGWDYVSLNGQTGWIHGGNLTTGTLPAAAQATQPAAQAAQAGQASYASTQSAIPATVLYGMNFRATPGMDGQIMSTVPAGSSVQYIGTSNGWDLVVYNGVQGWIAGGRITTQNAQASSSAANSYSQASSNNQAGSYGTGTAYGYAGSNYTTTSGNTGSYAAGTVTGTMNFRAQPDMTGSIMGIVPVGSKIQYLGSSNGWDKVVYQGTTGWIKSGYCN